MMRRVSWSLGFCSLSLCALTGCGDSGDEPAPAGAAGAGAQAPALLSHVCRGSDQRSKSPADFDGPEAEPALRDTGRRVGVALAASRLTEPAYAATAAREFNYVTAENEMKWDALEPSPGQFNFAPADSIVEFARQNQMQVKGHTLVWYSQLPAWVNALTGADAVRAAMTLHIESVIAHYKESYPGVVVAWDVVNEALDTPMGQAVHRDTVFLRELGEGYIAEAFEIAHRADPDALLFYNDYGIEGAGPKANATFDMVSALVAASVPIHGVGLQMHTGIDNRNPSREELRANIQRYVDLGLRVHISEMDVNLCTVSNGTFGLEAQRFRYNRVLGTCLEFEACDAFAVWGVTDRYSWLNERESCRQAPYRPKPLAFDDDYAKKPAWWGIYDALTGCVYD